MADSNKNSRRNRIIGGSILAAIIVIIILMVVPILGGEQIGMISTGGPTLGEQYSIHRGMGAYQ
jgi:hypothetical protein